MRLPSHSREAVSKPTAAVQKSERDVPSKTNSTTSGGNRGKVETTSEPVPASPIVAAPIVDPTRPTTVADLVLDLQRRVIEMEKLAYKKLTASEYAIVIEADTGQTLDWWKGRGYVVDKCLCSVPKCKGWKMTPVEHHRTASPGFERDMSPVRRTELKDADTDVVAVPESVDNTARHERLFKKMFKRGLLKEGKRGATLIPKDGPITWTHEEQLAFAHGFEMEELLALEGKPRELQRRLIAALKEIGYDILTGTEKE